MNRPMSNTRALRFKNNPAGMAASEPLPVNVSRHITRLSRKLCAQDKRIADLEKKIERLESESPTTLKLAGIGSMFAAP